MAPSSLLYYLGINKKIDGLLHHNLFFDESLDEHAEEIYTKPQWPQVDLYSTPACHQKQMNQWHLKGMRIYLF